MGLKPSDLGFISINPIALDMFYFLVCLLLFFILLSSQCWGIWAYLVGELTNIMTGCKAVAVGSVCFRGDYLQILARFIFKRIKFNSCVLSLYLSINPSDR